MKYSTTTPSIQVLTPLRSLARTPEIQTEVIRKSIHLLVAFVPRIAQGIGRDFTVILLIVGIVLYSIAEYLHRRGVGIPIVSRIIQLSSRKRDEGKFILAPITLGIGAALALMVYPEPAASIAIYALAFGDGLASLIGKVFGSVRIPHTKGKTLEGSLACFYAVFISSAIVLSLAYNTALPHSFGFALLIASVATALEAIPLRDLDNIILPVGTGVFVQFLYSL